MTKILEDFEASKGGMVIDQGDFKSLDSLENYIKLPKEFEFQIKGSSIVGSTISYAVEPGFGDANELFSNLEFELSGGQGDAITAVNLDELSTSLTQIGITGPNNTQYLVKDWKITTDDFAFGDGKTVKFVDTLTLQVIHRNGTDLNGEPDMTANWIWIRFPS